MSTIKTDNWQEFTAAVAAARADGSDVRVRARGAGDARYVADVATEEEGEPPAGGVG